MHLSLSLSLIKRRLSIFSNTLNHVFSSTRAISIREKTGGGRRREEKGGCDRLVVNSLDTREGWLRSEKARKERGGRKINEKRRLTLVSWRRI